MKKNETCSIPQTNFDSPRDNILKLEIYELFLGRKPSKELIRQRTYFSLRKLEAVSEADSNSNFNGFAMLNKQLLTLIVPILPTDPTVNIRVATTGLRHWIGVNAA